MKKVKATVIGHFGGGHEYLDGQTVKTKILTAELERCHGSAQVARVDTHGGKKKLLFMPFIIGRSLKRSENVITLPAQNGLRVIIPLLAIENVVFHRKLHYAVIGGWLPDYLKSHRTVAKKLKRFTGIYVETNTMKKALEDAGYTNIILMPNCKDLKILNESEPVCPTGEPYKLCTFSRVMKEKGIEDAVNAVRAVNDRFGRTVFTLDVYGPVDPAQAEWFDELQKAFPSCVRYSGTVPFDKSVDVVKAYFALLFPTHFYTEGIPGTILDAYAAGVPVIASRWESFADVVDDGVTGLGISFGDPNALTDQLAAIAGQPQLINEKRKACLDKARRYLPETGLSVLTNQI